MIYLKGPNTTMMSSAHKPIHINDLNKKSLQLDENCRLQFELAQCVHPFEFYVYANIDDHAAYEQLAKKLNEYYSVRERRLRTYSEIEQYSFISENAVCVCKSMQNGQFYRAKIMYYKQSEKRPTNSSYIENKRTTLRIVTYIDHGILDRTPIANIFPLVDEFATLAPYCIPCRLDLVEPVNEFVDGIWSDEAVEFFKNELKKCQSNIAATLYQNQEPLSFIRVNFSEPLSLIIFTNETDDNNLSVCCLFFLYLINS